LIRWQPAVPGAAVENGLPPLAASPGRTGARTAREIPVLILAAGMIAFLLKTFVAQAFFIPSGSMLPQLQINDRVVVSKLAYKLHDPRRGDIVVFDCPPTAQCPAPGPSRGIVRGAVRFVGERIGVIQPSTDEYIKRVIALPGETVEGKEGRVFVNGRALTEPYLKPEITTSDFRPVQVPAGKLWVMGDNRGNSSDSRVFGTINQSTVVGRTIVKVYPFPSASFL
jgi:signal peptidase I